jgi:transposase-like protein
MTRGRKKATTRRRAASSKKKEGGRFSAKRKADAVIRLLRGEELDALSRELGVPAATLSKWREQFLAGAVANLKSRSPSPQDEQTKDLKAMIGDLMMRNELLRERVRHAEGDDRPFPSWKPSD